MKHPIKTVIIKRWLIPNQNESKSSQWRIAFGLVADITMAIYVVSRRGHLFDIRDYQYAQLDLPWDFVIATVPLVVLRVLLPVLISKNFKRRWTAIALSFFPAYIAIIAWLQLIALLKKND